MKSTFRSMVIMKITALVVAGVICNGTSAIAQQQQEYGVDVSFPMHYPRITTDPSNGQLDASAGNRQEFYDRYLEGCRDFYGSDGDECLKTEEDRIAMNYWQPQSMQVGQIVDDSFSTSNYF